MQKLASQGYYNGKNLFIETAKSINDGGHIHASGYIPFDLNIGSTTFGKYFENDFLNLKTEAELSSLPFLSPYITELDSAEGIMKLCLNVKGPIGNLTRDGYILIQDGVLHTTAIKRSYQIHKWRSSIDK